MSETAQEKKIAGENGSDREMLEESDVENRWTPVALKLAVNSSEEAAAAGPTDDRGEPFDSENRWTPVALTLVMSGEDKS